MLCSLSSHYLLILPCWSHNERDGYLCDWKDPSGAAIWVNTAVKTEALPQLCLISHMSINEAEMPHAVVMGVGIRGGEGGGKQSKLVTCCKIWTLLSVVLVYLLYYMSQRMGFMCLLS